MNPSTFLPVALRRCGAGLLGLAAALTVLPAQAAFVSGSTGADGALSPTVNTEIQLPPSGVLNYTTVNIPSGVTVRFRKNAANTPVVILSSGDVTIAGTLDLRGGDAKPTGTYGDGAVGDDGQPGTGGPGGFDGGRGGREDAALRADVIRGGTGMGPGGGPGGLEGADANCPNPNGYYKYVGVGGGHASRAYGYNASIGNCTLSAVTRFGASYGSALLQPLIGGSGGGGGRGGSTYPGSGGGGGGGAILIAASGTLRVTGSIEAIGGDGGGASGTGIGGQGAGGSGGAIRLMATTITGAGGVWANGGCINYNNTRRQQCDATGANAGYGGSAGRIRFEAEAITFTGTSQPAYSADVPGPVFIADAPALRIASVGGQPVPDQPTGNADVTLPAGTTSVTVTFETTNVPTGNTVLLRVVPAYGQPIEALSPAIAGTTASGTASVTLTLPAGPSTLQATTTYTVVVAGSVDLSQFAQNEAVQKIEVTVPLDGPASAALITASGKRYDVPFDLLRAAGWRG